MIVIASIALIEIKINIFFNACMFFTNIARIHILHMQRQKFYAQQLHTSYIRYTIHSRRGCDRGIYDDDLQISE